MSREESAYAALGLRPGASRAAVDEAYRRLIKRYHPDMEGGDPCRAAEINRAYTELRRRGSAVSIRPRPRVPMSVQRRSEGRGKRAGWALVGAVAVFAAAAIGNDVPRHNSRAPVSQVRFEWPEPDYRPASAGRSSVSASFEEPLETAVIDRAIADAVKFHDKGDAAATAEFSRACHEKLRAEPSLTWFDSCTAFDEATVALSGDSPFTESGPFDAPSLIARQMGAARMLSNDTLGADSRLHQIRSRVELALVPGMDEPSTARP